MRTLRRFHLKGDFSTGEELTLDSYLSNYLSKVLRLKTNDQIQCFNGKGLEVLCQLLSVNNKKTSIQVKSIISKSDARKSKLQLAISLLKGQAMDRVMQQATELGATDIWLVQSERTNVHYGGSKLQSKVGHWFKICVASSEQSRATFIPEIHEPSAIESVMERNKSAKRMVFDPAGITIEKELELTNRILFVGPEGGWSSSELDFFKSRNAGIYSLGPRILRAENVPSVALALVEHAQNSY